MTPSPSGPSWIVVATTIALAACAPRSDENEPIGSAQVELVESEGGVPEGRLVAERLSVSVSRQCSGINLPPISDKSCVHKLLVLVAAADQRALRITRVLPAKPPDGPIEMRAEKVTSSASVELQEPAPTPGASAPSWSSDSGSGPTDRGDLLVEVAADGKVTLRFDRLAMTDRSKKSSFRLIGTIVLDCASPTADTARCPLGSGPARL